MTESEWLACTDPEPMLAALRASGMASSRKLWLLWAVTRRRVDRSGGEKDAEENEQVVDLFERYADGRVTWGDVVATMDRLYPEPPEDDPPEPTADAVLGCVERTWALPSYREGQQAGQLSPLLRDVFGPLPFRDVYPHPSWLAWNDGTVRRLTASAYEERSLPEGTLEADRLAVLADALEEAGCNDPEILGHLREQGGAHVRGCWVLDLLLGKS
jgi:hypothetical protein